MDTITASTKQIISGILNIITIYGKTFEGKVSWFCDFLLNCECFVLNGLLAIGIHYQKELLPQKFSREHSSNRKSFPPQIFCHIWYIVHSAQNKGWKLVGHSFKVGTLL